MSPAERGEAFEYTICIEDGFVVFDCGFVAPITLMWDEDGELTLDWHEAVSIAFKHPSDVLGRDHAVVELPDLDDDGDTFSFH